MSGAPTSVRSVRVRGVDTDAATARLRLGNLLAGSELRPSGLAPSAVLCVRRLIDPLPGTLRLETAEARPPPEWERAFVDALERALRSAARPAREAVPAGAEAVLFADRAELLACLARDARDGTAWTRWWWRSLRAGTAPGADLVVEAWLAAPEHVPAALALLAARGEAQAFVAALPLATAATLAERVAHVFGAAELRRALVSTASASAAAEPGAKQRPAPRAVAPPWRALVPETAERPLAPRRELLLGIALALRRSPTTARSPGFAAAVRTWLTPSPGPGAPEPESRPSPAGEPAPLAVPMPPAQASPRSAVPASQPLEEQPSPVFTPPPEAARGAEALPSTPGSAERPAPPRRHDGQAPARETPSPSEPEAQVAAQDPAPRPAEAAPSTPTRRTRDVPGRPTPPRRAPRARTEAAPPERRAPAQPPVAAPPLAWSESEPPQESPALVVETELGGVFYLLNLALFLGLYGDFTRPLEPGIPLDPWTYLALLSRRLLGRADRHDPLWKLLARLAGPSAFRPPRAWRAPRAWLEPFDHDGVWRWSAARGTLRLVHPAGLPVVAVPRTRDPAPTQLARELARLRLAPALRRTTLPPEPARPLARWVARLAAYADARLRLALGLSADAALDELLLRRNARVFVTDTHVDVVLRLAELPLQVRFAGLDRTPGWIPAAGRFVSLHFE